VHEAVAIAVHVEDALEGGDLLPLAPVPPSPAATAPGLETRLALGTPSAASRAAILLETAAALAGPAALVPGETAPGLETARLLGTAASGLRLLAVASPLGTGASGLETAAALAAGPTALVPGETAPGLGPLRRRRAARWRSTALVPGETAPGLHAALAHETAPRLGHALLGEASPGSETRIGLGTDVLTRATGPTLVTASLTPGPRSAALLLPTATPATGPLLLAPPPDMGRVRPAVSIALEGDWPPALQAEALALLEQLAAADHVAQGALELGLLTRVQVGQLQQFLDAERMLGLGQVSLHVTRKIGHERSRIRKPSGRP
jgi:hypothetical protein